MRELALNILDISENSVSAQAKNVRISVLEDALLDRLEILVTDDGKGMDAATVAAVVDPFVTSRTTRKVGLGIPLFKEAAESCKGSFRIDSTPAVGTEIFASFQLSHIDRMPLGDLAETWLGLLVAHPEIHWQFEYTTVSPIHGRQEFLFDDAPVKETLEGIPLCDPTVLSYLRQLFTQSIDEIAIEPTTLFIKQNESFSQK